MSLKSLRIASGMTQREAAERFGIKYRTYQNYENGVTFPNMDTAARFAKFFSCTIGDLFDLQEGNEPLITSAENDLLVLYRNMSNVGQVTLVAIANTLATQFPKD